MKTMVNAIMLIIICIILCGGKAMEEGKIILELNTVMMRNTYKIEGEGSLGSCFLVGKPIKEQPGKARFILVTANHVLEQIKGEEATIYLRKKSNDNSFIKIPWKIKIRQSNNDLWIKNKRGIDVAVLYVSLPKDIDYELISYTNLASDKDLTEYEIHPGDEMYCLGFPFGTEANEAGFPILRSGKVASYPLVPTMKNESFLLDFKVFKGNSGGPVYFVDTNRFYGGNFRFNKIQFIAGIVSKEFNITETIKALYETKQQIHPLSLAVIIHASHIRETIDQLPEAEK